jgi:hypothetical protein
MKTQWEISITADDECEFYRNVGFLDSVFIVGIKRFILARRRESDFYQKG